MEENATRMDDMGSVEDLEALRKQHKDLESRLAALDRHLSLTAAGAGRTRSAQNWR